MQTTNINSEPISDKYNLVYLILLLHGVGILMPWNMFITARSYFVDYKLFKDYTGEDLRYGTYFLSYVSFASQIPLVIFNWINVFINISESVTPRIVSSLSVEIIIFVITIILAIIDTSQCLVGFFWSTMVSIVILNMATGIYQNTIYGMAAKLPFKHTAAIILGCNISGSVVSFTDLISNIITPSTKAGAIFYFSSALLILLLCLATYFVLPYIKFYRHSVLLKEKSVDTNADSAKKVPYWNIFKKASYQLFNIFFIFFVTLSVFPALQADIKKFDPNFIIPEKYYENIMCFLTFNITATLGCILSNWIKWDVHHQSAWAEIKQRVLLTKPRLKLFSRVPSPKMLLFPVLLRVLFIPFFFFCNYQPNNKVRRVPVLIPNDWVYWCAGILLGFTSGYLSSKAMIYTTGSVEIAYGSISGKLGAAVIVTGIFFGIVFSMMFPWLAEV